ncbi:LOW QUALITY PROTEIN: Plant organelle RNA recognition domain [Dillenia turbinata]|uniref:Plant organelle RNA recognition domain n=1 Tax=Dillenia turbinata TaxID=194707 RepID=A0AAN8ZH38_9MAGN
MSKHKAVSADKLIRVKREFGFTNDFMIDLVPMYPNYFSGSPVEGKSFIELVDWNPEFAESVIEKRAEKESASNVRLPPGFFLKKEMGEWVRGLDAAPLYITLRGCVQFGSIFA